MPDELPRHLAISQIVGQATEDLIVDTVRRIAGNQVAMHFKQGVEYRIDTGAHGKKGQSIEIGGGYGFNENEVLSGDPVAEAMLFTRMGIKQTRNQTDEQFMLDKLFVASHESFHAVQLRYLSSAQLRVMNTAFAKLKLALANQNWFQFDKPIEKQAQAFEAFDQAYVQGAEPGAAVLLAMDPQSLASLKETNKSHAILDL